MTTQQAKEMTPAQKIEAWAEAHGVTMTVEFVPLSLAKVKHPERFEPVGGRPWVGITWDIKLLRNGRAFLETTYSAGVAHCPGYKMTQGEAKASSWSYTVAKEQLCAWECEHGKPGRFTWTVRGGIVGKGGKIDAPPLASVLASLNMDAGVLNEGPFEEWAASLGYDPDSRKAEAIHRACLDIALKLRGAIGEAGLEALAEAAQDY